MPLKRFSINDKNWHVRKNLILKNKYPIKTKVFVVQGSKTCHLKGLANDIFF